MNNTQKNPSWLRVTGLCITISLIVGMIGGALTNEYLIGYFFNTFIGHQNESNLTIVKKVTEYQTYVEESATIDAIAKVEPSIVTLYASSLDLSDVINKTDEKNMFLYTTSDQYYLNKTPVSVDYAGAVKGGNGFFISTDGLIATCSSVVNSQIQWNVLTASGDSFLAEVVYSNPNDDLTLLKAKDGQEEKINQKAVLFSDSELVAGQKVLTTGKDAAANLHVKSGIVSYNSNENSDLILKRQFPVQFIQTDYETDSSLHCSPLINLNGEVAGVTLDFDTVEQGTSYAIPVAALKQTLINYQKDN